MYTYPSATINNMTFTAKRWGQFPTITYVDGTNDTVPVTAGHEVVTVASNLSNITVRIEPSASTNLQIKTAILACDVTTESLYPRDLVSVAIANGHNDDTNSTVTATALSGSVNVPPTTDAPIPNMATKAYADTEAASVSTDAAAAASSATDAAASATAADASATAADASATAAAASATAAASSASDAATSASSFNQVSILAADPGTPTEGQVWYNTTTHLLKFYNGTDVKTVAVVA